MAQRKGGFVLRPFRPQLHIDSGRAQSIWESLKAAIARIHEKNASVLSFEELYRCVSRALSRRRRRS